MKQKIITRRDTSSFHTEIESALYFGWKVVHLAGGENGWCAILEIEE